MSKDNIKKISGSLDGLIPHDWFKDRAKSSIWLRIYTCLFVPREKFLELLEDILSRLNDATDSLPVHQKMLFAGGTITGMKIPVATMEMYSLESGQLKMSIKSDQKELPDTTYIFLGVPYCVDGTPGDESAAKARLDINAGLICLHIGLNFLRDIVFDGELKTDGTISHASDSWKMPQKCEGPFLAPQNAENIDEIFRHISQLHESKRGRVNLAIRLMNTAMREKFGFFEYWTALEVITNGKSGRIKARLGKIYGIKNHKEASDLAGFTTLEQWRHNYIHRGISPIVNADVERYLQLLFLDLLRQEIDLPHKGHIAGMQAAAGYDLSPIGLADKRTQEQKEGKMSGT